MTPPLWMRCVLLPLWLVRAALMVVVLPVLVVVIVVAAFLMWDADLLDVRDFPLFMREQLGRPW